jgi:hypothetical protein
MHKNYFTYILFLILSVNILAQDDTTLSDHFSPSKQECQNALQFYLISLNHWNEGVVQSGIENIMKIKCHHSELNYGEVLSKLQQLAENAKSNDTRTMAFICSNYLLLYNPSIIEKQKTHELMSLIINR